MDFSPISGSGLMAEGLCYLLHSAGIAFTHGIRLGEQADMNNFVKLYLGYCEVSVGRYVTWCDLDLTAGVTLTLKKVSGLYLGNFYI